MIPTDAQKKRAQELLADRATDGLDAQGEAELRSIFGPRWVAGRDDIDGFEIAAAAVHLSATRGRLEAMPPHLAQAIAARAGATIPMASVAQVPASLPPASLPASVTGPPAAGPQAVAGQGHTMLMPPRERLAEVVPLKKPSPVLRALPWIAAAACFAFAVTAWLVRGPVKSTLARPFEYRSPVMMPSAPAPVDLASARADLLKTATDAVEIAWSAGKDPADAQASGDVVWSDKEQRGFMRFKGVATNDPKVGQYQLWIFDAERDDKFPVDGGVFDVGSGEIIVPIKAKLDVKKAKLFAVTAEKPGGVVVSKRERLVVTAAVKTG